MDRRAAISQAADILRAAGNEADADELIAGLDDELDPPEVVVEPVVVVEVVEPEPEPAPESQADVVAAVAAGEVDVIQARTDAEIALMETAEQIRDREREAETAAAVEVAEVLEEVLDDDPDPDPRSGHWFYRKLRSS